MNARLAVVRAKADEATAVANQPKPLMRPTVSRTVSAPMPRGATKEAMVIGKVAERREDEFTFRR